MDGGDVALGGAVNAGGQWWCLLATAYNNFTIYTMDQTMRLIAQTYLFRSQQVHPKTSISWCNEPFMDLYIREQSHW